MTWIASSSFSIAHWQSACSLIGNRVLQGLASVPLANIPSGWSCHSWYKSKCSCCGGVLVKVWKHSFSLLRPAQWGEEACFVLIYLSMCFVWEPALLNLIIASRSSFSFYSHFSPTINVNMKCSIYTSVNLGITSLCNCLNGFLYWCSKSWHERRTKMVKTNTGNMEWLTVYWLDM